MNSKSKKPNIPENFFILSNICYVLLLNFKILVNSVLFMLSQYTMYNST